jgi:hypothetical protein
MKIYDPNINNLKNQKSKYMTVKNKGIWGVVVPRSSYDGGGGGVMRT